jgi:FkbM family methyltransferase
VRARRIHRVGAHIGIYTLLLADLFESGVCLDPAPDAHSILVKNLGLNGLHRFDALRLGASSVSGRAVLTAEGPYSGEARIVADDAVAAIRFDIEITTVDALIQPSWKVTFIKIDTEGHEPEVIAGAVETLRRSPEALVLFENNPGGRAECMNRLEGLGFRCFALDESGNVSQSAADFKESSNALAAGPSHPLSQRLRAL